MRHRQGGRETDGGGAKPRAAWPRLWRAVLVALWLAAPAAAQEGPVGVAFAQAEEGTWWCAGRDADETGACAVAKCRADSGGQECTATRWCTPAGWSGLMVVWLPEFHATHVLCGMPNREATGAALRAICDAGTEFTRCDLVLFIAPDGTEFEATDTIWPGPAAAESQG